MDGRHKTPPNVLDLAGKRFGKLVAIERAGKTKKDQAGKTASVSSQPAAAASTAAKTAVLNEKIMELLGFWSAMIRKSHRATIPRTRVLTVAR